MVTSGTTVYGYPYGYTPPPAYYGNPYPAPYPYPYAQNPYAQTPQWQFYGYNGPATGGYSGSYQNQTNSTYGRATIGNGRPSVSIGGSRTTTSGSYSTFP